MTQDRLIFLIGAPRSGTTLLARMLGAHSAVYGRAEPHLITPIAHLGYYANVQKAPYDPLNAEQAIKEIVADLPGGEADYLDALRAYTDTLYARLLALGPGKRFFLDKTPAYALGIPFEPQAIAYGEQGNAPKGLGDPTGVARHTRPVTESVDKWAAEIAADGERLQLVSRLIDTLDPADLETLGYPRAEIVAQLEATRGAPVPVKRAAPTRYALERKLLVALRRNIHRNRLGRLLKRVRFALDVVLRE